jgi:hypothetical protein
MKVYKPKLSKNILKSCKGCAILQRLISAEGYGDHVRERAQNLTMFSHRNGGSRCALGYAVKDIYLEHCEYMPIPIERCPKPRTRQHYHWCEVAQMRGELKGSIIKG